MNWKPWNTLEKQKPHEATNYGDPITEPPCRHCRSFAPQVVFIDTPEGQKQGGVRICHANEMHHDFSCFVQSVAKQFKSMDKSKPAG